MNLSWFLVFCSSFIAMEFNAWALHKYVMHGHLWFVHQDHHQPVEGRKYQLNDAFAIFFAVPSFLFILFDSLKGIPLLGACGYGIMAYGACYFLVHEVIIHRRWKLFNLRKIAYFEALNAAHKIHHSILEKEGASNFGMLIVPLSYFTDSIRRMKNRKHKV